MRDLTREIEHPVALIVGSYTSTDKFQAIDTHTAVLFDEGKPLGGLVAVTGLAGDPLAEKYARWFASSPRLIQAMYFLGGGSTYLDSYNRLCFCLGCVDVPTNHSSSCDMAWEAFQLAVPNWEELKQHPEP